MTAAWTRTRPGRCRHLASLGLPDRAYRGRTSEERAALTRSYIDAQLEGYADTLAWFFWSYKLLAEGSDRDGWDLRKSIELGYLPENPGR